MTFADTATTEVPPTTDRAAVAAAIDGVQLNAARGLRCSTVSPWS